MKKNPHEFHEPLQVDPISGEYYAIIPEWIVNELSWYEDMEININLDGNEIVISEKKQDG